VQYVTATQRQATEERQALCKQLSRSSTCYQKLHGAYVVSHFESVSHLRGHAGVVERHEDGVDDDADGDEHVDERVGDEELDDASERDPAAAALPAEHQLVAASLPVLLACQRHRVVQLLRHHPAAQTA